MVDVADTNTFESLPLPQKISFFETKIDEVVDSLEETKLNKFLKTIVLDDAENAYLRRRALEVFTDCVFFEKLKARQELIILIDDWNENEEIFLEIRRLKDLFLFYFNEPEDIEEIYKKQTANHESEIAAESYYHLGLIEMQRALSSDSESDCISSLNNSYSFFKKSSEEIENRIDAYFFQIVTSLIIDLLEEKLGEITQKIKELSNILLQKDIFSMSGKQNYFHISFYRTLLNLHKLKSNQVSGWLDFRKGCNDLLYYFNEIKNLEIKNKLNESILNKTFSAYIEKSFVQPYFAQNFTAEISKIEARLAEPGLTPEQQDFLFYIKELANNADLKETSDKESIRQRLINSFPERNVEFIDQVLSGVSALTSSSELMTVCEILKNPSLEKFIDALVSSCIELQGNQLYRSSKLKEISDDEVENLRNDYINSLLDAKGYITRDQTRWSSSYEGKRAGEIDIFVRESDKTLFAIIEALNLDSLKKDYLNLHLDKIFKYDTSGLKQNFILVYSTAKSFSELWKKYVEHIRAHTYEYEFKDFEEITSYQFADLKIGKAKHIRNGSEIFLYHILLNLS